MTQVADRTGLAALTAEFWQLDVQQVSDDLAFSISAIRKFNSMRFYRFIASIEDAFGVRIADPGSMTTFGRLREVATQSPAERTGHQAAAVEVVQPEPRASTNNLHPGVRAVGHDIEEIANLPTADDYRTAPFYTSHFTAAEIEYCLQSTHPLQHFAARFCAKEAVRKCGPQFAAINPRNIEVLNDEAGQPSIRINGAAVDSGTRLLVSLSHSALLASAFVIAIT
jgi:phosphopantetheine--protein transferase-like protein